MALNKNWVAYIVHVMYFDRTWKSLCMTKIKRLIYKPSHNCTQILSMTGLSFLTSKYISIE